MAVAAPALARKRRRRFTALILLIIVGYLVLFLSQFSNYNCVTPVEIDLMCKFCLHLVGATLVVALT